MSSNLFVKSDLQDILTTTVSNTDMPAWLTVNEQAGGINVFKNNSATSDVFMSQINTKDINELINLLTSEENNHKNRNVTSEIIPDTVVLSATSTVVPQKGGDNTTSEYVPESVVLSTTSALKSQKGGKLCSHDDKCGHQAGGAAETDTEALEVQLRNLLKGGAKRRSSKRRSSKRKSSKRRSSKGGSMEGGKRRKSKKSSKKTSKKTSKKASKKTSKKTSKRRSMKGGEVVVAAQEGGKRRKSKKASKKASKRRSMKGGDVQEGGKRRKSKRRSMKGGKVELPTPAVVMTGGGVDKEMVGSN